MRNVAERFASTLKGSNKRARELNSHPANKHGKFVLYWVQASPRTVANPALEFAISCANHHHQPLLACFCLVANFPFANRRHYSFLLQGLVDFAHCLRAQRGIEFRVARCPDPVTLLEALQPDVTEVIVDMGYLRIQRQWYEAAAKRLKCPLTQVEANVVVPVQLASDKEEFAARTIRPKIWTHAKEFLKEVCMKINFNFV